MNLFGYVRVSDASQNEDRQMISMAEQGVPAKNIYVDKQSGKDFERKSYRSMLRRLKPGDCVILHSLDRLGRDYAAILEQWQFITKDKGADIGGNEATTDGEVFVYEGYGFWYNSMSPCISSIAEFLRGTVFLRKNGIIPSGYRARSLPL